MSTDSMEPFEVVMKRYKGSAAVVLTGSLLLLSCTTTSLDRMGPAKTGEVLQEQLRLRFLQVIGSPGSGPGQFLDPQGISLDPEGNVYIADTGNDRIQKLNGEGNFVIEIGGFGFDEEQFNEPRDLCATVGLDIYVADSQNRRLQRFDRYLNYLSTIVPNPNLDESLQFGVLSGIDISSTGDIYLADSENDRILKLDSFERPERSFGDIGYGRGRLSGPASLTVDERSTVYVCDSGHDRIAIYDIYGEYRGSLGEGILRAPRGVDLDEHGNVFVSDTGNNRLVAFNLRGEVISTFGSLGAGLGSFRSPHDLAVDHRGVLYVLDTGNGRIQKFSIEYQ